MKFVVTVWQNAKYRGVIEAESESEAYDIAQELVIEEELPNSTFEWVNEDLDFDVRKCR